MRFESRGADRGVRILETVTGHRGRDERTVGNLSGGDRLDESASGAAQAGSTMMPSVLASSL